MAKYQAISEDVIRQVITVEEKEALQKYHKMQKGIKEMRDEVAELKKDQEALRNQGGKNGKQWKENAKEIAALNKRIKEETKDLNELRDSMSINCMTMAQLRKISKDLARELDHMSAAANPEEYARLSQRLADVKNRMRDLSIQTKYIKDGMVESQTQSFLWGTAIVKAGEWGISALNALRGKTTEMISQSVELAESADGVLHAFEQIDRHDELLGNLRKATKGTVNDFELMKAAMKAKDFHIPLEDLGKLLSFAQLKAQQTGQSVDYMVESIVTGLGRQSKMILDNLGISAAEIDEKVQETGDFAKAVASIVDKQLTDAGEHYVSAADRALQKTTQLQNKQLELGRELMGVKEAFTDTYGSVVVTLMGALKWIITHKKETAVLAVALAGLTAAIIVQTTSLKAYFAETKAGIVITRAWTALVTTLKGIYLLTAAAVNTLRGNTAKAAAEMRLFNMTCRANVVLALATGVIALGVAVYALISRQQTATDYAAKMNAEYEKMKRIMSETGKVMKRDIEDVEKQAANQAVETANKMKLLRKTIEDNHQSNKKRIDALNELKKIVPGYHAQLTSEGKLINNNTRALDDYIVNLKKTAQAQAVVAKMGDIARDEMENQLSRQTAQQQRNYQSNQALREGVNLHTMRVREATRTYTDNWGNQRKGAERYEVVDAAGNVVKGMENVSKRLFVIQQEWDRRTAELERHDTQTHQNNMRSGQLEDYARRNGLDLTAATRSGKPTEDAKADKPTADASKEANQRDTRTVNAFKAARQTDIDEARQAYQEDVNALKQALADKRLSQEEYNGFMASLAAGHTAHLQGIEQAYYEQSQQLTLSDGEKKKAVVAEQQRNTAKAEQDAYDARLKQQEDFQKNMDQLEKAAMTDKEKEAFDYTLQLQALKGYYEASRRYAEEHAMDLKQIDDAYDKARQKLQADHEQRTKERQQKEVEAVRQTEQQKQQMRQQYGLTSLKEQYDMELAMLREHLEKEKITVEEYERAKRNVRMRQWKEQFDYFASLFSDGIKALQDAELANVEAKYEGEIEAAQRAGKDTTALEYQYAKEKLEIEKKFADVQFAIDAARIIVDTGSAVVKAYQEYGYIAGSIIGGIISAIGTAQLAIAAAQRSKVKNMTLGNASGNASVPTGARVANGREEGGYIEEETDRKKNSDAGPRRKEYSDAGPRRKEYIDVERSQDGKMFHARYEPERRGFVDRPTVIVGEGPAGRSKEWVASNDAVENPTVRPVIDAIDQAQRTGTVRTLDLRKVLLRQQGLAQGGFLSTPAAPAAATTLAAAAAMPLAAAAVPLVHTVPGGFAAGSAAAVPAAASLPPAIMERFVAALERMERDGIPALVGIDMIEAKQQQRDQSRAIGSK